MLKVEIRKGQSVEKALKIFKRKVKDSGIMFDLKERSFYKKPSAIKREQKNKAKLRAKYEKLKNQEDYFKNWSFKKSKYIQKTMENARVPSYFWLFLNIVLWI